MSMMQALQKLELVFQVFLFLQTAALHHLQHHLLRALTIAVDARVTSST